MVNSMDANKQLLSEEILEIELSATGTGIQDVTGQIFKQMRTEVYKSFSYPIIQMEAKEVYFNKVESKKRTERFLFLFMPRERIDFQIGRAHV